MKDLPPDRQQRVLRWVAEGLGVTTTSTGAPTPPLGVTPPVVPPLAAPTPLDAATDIKSFVTAKAPKSDSQFAAVAAYFYRFEAPPAQRRDTIDGDRLQEAARFSGRKRLLNPIWTLNNAKAAGYLDGTTPGEFAINSVGENLVAMTLPGTPNGGARNQQKKKISKKKSKIKIQAKKG